MTDNYWKASLLFAVAVVVPPLFCSVDAKLYTIRLLKRTLYCDSADGGITGGK